MTKQLNRLSSEAYLGAITSIIREIPPAGGSNRTKEALDLLDERLASMGLVVELKAPDKP